ncbi:hypothetical protein ACSSS7_004262 [Eimeria intestinalis]
MQIARASLGSLWPQLQTQELLADLQWVADEENAPGASEGPPARDGALPQQQQQQQLQLIQILKAASEGRQPAAVAAAAALFQCERQRQQLFQEVRQLLRLPLPRQSPKEICIHAAGTPRVSWRAAAAAGLRAAPAAAAAVGRGAHCRQHLVWSTAFNQHQQEQQQQQQQQQLLAALSESICLEAAAAAAFPSQLPSTAQSLEAYCCAAANAALLLLHCCSCCISAATLLLLLHCCFCCKAAALPLLLMHRCCCVAVAFAGGERVLQLPVVFGGKGPCECGPLDLRQIEKDVTRETYSINNHILKGAAAAVVVAVPAVAAPAVAAALRLCDSAALSLVYCLLLAGADGLLRLLLALCSRIREAEAAAGHAAAIETEAVAAAAAARETAAAAIKAATHAGADGSSSSGLPKTVEALVSLGLLTEEFCSSSSNRSSNSSNSSSYTGSAAAAAAAAWPRGVWAAACRVFCALRILAVSSRTHGGGAAFAAAAHAFACPALPLLLQPDNQVATAEQQQQQQQQEQQQQERLMTLPRGSANVTEVVTTCCARLQRETTQGPLLAELHATTPFKLLLPDHESQGTSLEPSPPQQQQQQQELVRRLRSVAVDAHFFATLRSVSLRLPSEEVLQFDKEVAHEVRRREAAASVLALAITREVKTEGEEGQLLTWLPAAETQQWIFVTCAAGRSQGALPTEAQPRAVETLELQ